MLKLYTNMYQKYYILRSFSKQEVYGAIDRLNISMVSLEKSVEGFLRHEEAIYNLYQTVTSLTVSNNNSDNVEKVVNLLLVHENKVRHIRQMVQHRLRNYKMDKVKEQLVEKTFHRIFLVNKTL